MTNDQIVEKVAEYLSIAPFLKVDSPAKDYQRARQLALELVVHLTPHLYSRLYTAISKPNESCNPGTIFVAIVHEYTKKTVDPDKIIGHAPGIGENSKRH